MFVLKNALTEEQEHRLVPLTNFEPPLPLSDERVEICYSEFVVMG